MKKVVTPSVMAAMDRKTIEGGVPSVQLMEKAGVTCAEIIGAGLSLLDKAVVVCGGGNNGGDGFVIACQLAEEGHPVRVLCTGDPAQYSPESRFFYDKLSQLDMPIEPELAQSMTDEALNDAFQWASVIVDCLFGNGLTDRPLSEKYTRIIDAMNHAGKPITAVDIPSGLRGDTGTTLNIAVKAVRTIAIQCIKVGCLINDGPDYCGEILTVDIGIEGETGMKLFEYEDLIWPVPRKKNSHKYEYGAVAAVVGSSGMVGAGQMASESALTAGAGLVTIFVPKNIFQVMAMRMAPEVMVKSYLDEQIIPDDYKTDVVLFGCGVGRSADYKLFLEKIFASSTPMVIDADGLWHLAQHLDSFKAHQGPVVITPHLGELAVLTGLDRSEIAADPVKTVRDFALEYNTVVVLKGYRTMICSPTGEVWFNSTGNPGMATAGSGDVLAGIITGIMAQGIDPVSAACHGVYYHGAAGDVYAGRFNETTMKATDITSFLKVVMNDREGVKG